MALTGEKLRPWEVLALREVDAAILALAAKRPASRGTDHNTIAAASDPASVAAMMQTLSGRTK